MTYDDDNDDEDDDNGYDDGSEICNIETPVHSNNPLDWRKFSLITGKPGTRKSRVLLAVIEKCIAQGCRVFVAAPTGYLARYYRGLFQSDITSNTVHSAFHYSINKDEAPAIHWNISRFDIIIFDEVSMVPERIGRHVMDTLSQVTIHPVVLLAGDNQQQQPIESVSMKVREVKSLCSDKKFYLLVHHYKLSVQYRCMDPEYEKFLSYIRY